VSEKYEFIETMLISRDKYVYPVVLMCLWLSISRSGFYDWRSRPTSAAATRRSGLRLLISHVFDGSDQTYGYRRVHAELGRAGVDVGPELVRHLMRELDLVPCQPRPFRLSLTAQDLEQPAIADLVRRDFTATVPGTKLVGDITYVPTWEGWVYLATVIDCYSKKVIAYAMDDNYKTPLISTAIRRAAKNENLAPKAIFHTDRGSNYTSHEFGTVLKELDLRRSSGRTGICYDNAMAESFFAALKNELVNRTVYPTRRAAMNDIARFIETRYNPKRLHSAIGYRPPNEVHDAYESQQQAA
jgi:transposase InsO family protein